MNRLVTVIFVLFATALSANAQDQNVPPELPQWGSEVFRGLLNFAKVEPVPYSVANVNRTELNFRDRIVVVIGAPKTFEQDREIGNFVRAVVRDGGSVLIAIREPYDLAKLLPVPVEYAVTTPGLRFYGQDNTPETLPEDQRSSCPIVLSKPFDLFTTDSSPDWNPFRGLARIATFQPACLEPTATTPRRSFPLAWLPPGSVAGAKGGRKLPRKSPFAIGSDTMSEGRPTGKLVVLADERVLSNRMIALPGTDNLPFAMKLIALLKGPESENRTRAVFYENGKYVDRFDDVKFSVNRTPPLPIPPPQVLDQLATQIADGMVDQVDRSDAPNSLLARNQIYYARLVSLLILIVSGMALLFFARRAFASRSRPDRTAMPLAPLARVRPAKGLVGQMRQDVLVAGDFGPLVREYVVELFVACGLPAGGHDRLPGVHYKGKAENTPALLADLTKLWATTYGPPTRITLATWKDLEPMLQRVWRAAEAGRWQFAPAAGAT